MSLPRPSTAVRFTVIEAGYTQHPGRTVSPRLGMEPVKFPANVALIEHPKEGLYLFDTGYSSGFREYTRPFPQRLYRWATPVWISEETTAKARLASVGYELKDVHGVILSHFHADHAGGARDFAKTRFIFDRKALGDLGKMSRIRQTMHGFIPEFLPENVEDRASDYRSFSGVALPFQNFPKGHDLFGDQSVILVALDGHALGHIGLLVFAQPGEWKFLVADAAWTHDSYRHVEMPSAVAQVIFSDRREYRSTLEELHRIYESDPGVEIIPCHCERLGERLSQSHAHA